MWTPTTRQQHSRPGLRYETDLTDAEWALIEPLMPKPQARGRPWAWPLREILNAIVSVLRGGIPWRLLPRDLPPRSTVHGWFVRWHCDGVLDRLHFALYQQARELAGKEASPTAAIVDSQSVKSLEKGAGLSIRSAMTRAKRSKARSGTPSSIHWA